MVGIFPRVCVWSVTVFLIFTNVYLVWEYVMLDQGVSVGLYVPVLCIATILYIFCVYLVGRDDINALVDFCTEFLMFRKCFQYGNSDFHRLRREQSHERCVGEVEL